MKTNRRKFIQSAGLGAAALGVATPALASVTRDKADKDAQVLFIGDNIAVANTTYGKVRGFIMRGINTFLGIPYGADTSGANRFMPPQKPKPWTEVLPTVWWGNTAPQNMERRYANVYASFIDHWNYDDVSEDCLKLNVWTPATNDGKKRPVMVWLHGGGYANGNAIEQDGYHGENFSRKGNIVFVSINHRLGPFGYAHFGAAGEKFAASGNAGMLDCVAALQWIRDNISSFGGDPGNVTIMGQSGGGAKVCVLTSMPSAKGLFHKAVPLSGSSLKAVEKVNAEKLASYVLKEAGLTYNDMDKLQQMPWKQYLEFATKGLAKFREEMKLPAFGGGGGFAPVVDGTYLPQHPYNLEPAASAADVPMLISCSCVFGQNLDSLKAGFKDPPASAWPRTWWHWTRSNVNKEGITKDLEWMKRSGIGGFQLADVNAGDGQTVNDPVIFGSPQWLDAVNHTAAEAERLNLEMAIFSSAGWSLTGGSWVL